MRDGTNVRKYGRPQPTTMVRPAAVEGYGASTFAMAFSSRVFALVSAALVQLTPLLSLAVNTSLCSGGIATVTPLLTITSTWSIRYCSWKRRITGAASARGGPPANWSSTSYTPRAATDPIAIALVRRRNARRSTPNRCSRSSMSHLLRGAGSLLAHEVGALEHRNHRPVGGDRLADDQHQVHARGVALRDQGCPVHDPVGGGERRRCVV